MRRFLFVVAGVVLVATGVFFFLGRSWFVDTVRDLRPPGSGREERLMTVRLYFGDPNGSGLRAEDRVLLVGETLEQRLQDCVGELAAGPSGDAVPSIPPRTRLDRAFLDPWGLAYLDFDRSLLGRVAPGDYEEWLSVASLVRTVCDNFPEVREVRFMVEGQVVTSLNGYIDLEESLDSRDFPLTPAAGGI